MNARFEDNTVIVTGASRGLGRSIATAFGAEGAFVFVGYRSREDEAKETLRAMEEAGGRGALLAMDVASAASMNAAVEQALAARGSIDVLVNNAGVAADELFPLMAEESWDEVMRVNAGGAFHGCRAVVRPMMAKRRGAIVNVASVAGQHASPGQSNYAASKGAILAFTRTLAAELAPRGIRVNAVVPGLLGTGMAKRLDKRIAEKARGQIPLGRFGTGDEVARAVLFLASEEASYVIGQALVVDGGLTL
ncbi:3-oxoacyl-ACP reductase FabG [Polyangium sp. y55x31]|uniref:3-oxoacyl-ACP reductase FabG n=1 Tax=Polyangium sp. y55x31 TaxID=3042688 RepID=UPI0024828BB6|nr:3-oxoacyl-ACP reductase FabG [Polyangium sp. y55x31]MDI1477005.1 3-oxoacyl-ACP reductase FabG [Polyangium sp. y55x31]